MDQFIDNLARELAKPTSRRNVMRLIGGAMFGGVIAAWTPSSLKAQACSPACKKNETCCTTGSSPFCANGNKTCCGNTSCPNGHLCCGSGPTATCVNKPKGTACCGNTAFGPGETCCNNTVCCNAKQVCISGSCVASKGKK